MTTISGMRNLSLLIVRDITTIDIDIKHHFA